jgi:16S rRNA (uracil1498-N3)-methyltransferase
MRLTRVFVDAPLAQDALLPLPAGPAQHLARVLRLGDGDPLIVFNGRGGEYAASIESVRRHEVIVRLGAHDPVERESPRAIMLLQGIARGDKMDQIVQKATELGVTSMIPVLSSRSNVRLDDDAAQRKQEHWQGVAIAACEQCGRNRVPVVARPLALAVALREANADLRLAMMPDECAGSLHSLLAAAVPTGTPASVALLIGPEGGLEPAEARAAAAADFTPCRLGPRVLRTETAALAALAALQFAAGDLR